jgi:hypothetical protein
LVATRNITYLKSTTTVYQMLVALKKRLAPTDEAKKIQFIAQYNRLKKFQKNESIEQWLQDWEKTYIEAKALSLPDVADERPLYDFT